MKFDQASATGEEFSPTPRWPLWDSPVTSVLVAYAGCPGQAGGRWEPGERRRSPATSTRRPAAQRVAAASP